ncbi:EAL domain-containing protein [Solidesulfovibrio sp.]
MAHTFILGDPGARALGRTVSGPAAVPSGNLFFRALVDLGTGGVAGIEAARANAARRPLTSARAVGSGRRVHGPGHDPLGAWGGEVRDPAAYLVRGDLTASAAQLAVPLGVSAGRIIIMYDVSALLRDPARALDVLLAAKRAGSRVLLDNFSMDDPPARFMEMLPADILRLAPRQMPWHWDEARRQEAVSSLVRFADNLLMDVAVAGVQSSLHQRELRQLGVRYGQGGWRQDTAGVLPDPGA